VGNRSGASGSSPRIDIVGLGPGGLAGTPLANLELLADSDTTVIVRTERHPAAAELASRRRVIFCDDLYEHSEDFESVYLAIAERVVGAAEAQPVVYAVPGSPRVGELAVPLIRALAGARGIECRIHTAESFLDAVLAVVGVDPLTDGFQVLNGHRLPDPLVLDKPTVIGHLDMPELLADVAATLDRVIGDQSTVYAVIDAGMESMRLVEAVASQIDPGLAGLRTSLFVPATPGGLVGAVHAMRRLRTECPWDREQTHDSLVPHLVEETHELIEALSNLDPEDWISYGAVEEELGDLLLQVLFHTNIASEAGAFGIDDVSERLRQKLIRRHPHVFGGLEVVDASEVKANWDRIKAEEKGSGPTSRMDGIPPSLPGTARAAKVQKAAAKVGFDWVSAKDVIPKVREELDELEAVLTDPRRREEELGDLLFSLVNLARHLDLDPEIAVRRATARFEDRFRAMEELGPLDGLTLTELDELWNRVKKGKAQD